MPTNEELQAQIDALRAALGAIPGLRVQDMNPSDLSKLTGPPLRVWSSADFKTNLDRFDEIRGAD